MFAVARPFYGSLVALRRSPTTPPTRTCRLHCLAQRSPDSSPCQQRLRALNLRQRSDPQLMWVDRSKRHACLRCDRASAPCLAATTGRGSFARCHGGWCSCHISVSTRKIPAPVRCAMSSSIPARQCPGRDLSLAVEDTRIAKIAWRAQLPLKAAGAHLNGRSCLGTKVLLAGQVQHAFEVVGLREQIDQVYLLEAVSAGAQVEQVAGQSRGIARNVSQPP